MLDESNEAENGLGEPDEQVKQKMMSDIQAKYTELGRIDEHIRQFENLKSRKSEVTKYIYSLEGSLQKVLPSD